MARPRGARARAEVVLERLAREYPGDAATLCELDFADPYQLLVATILSAQSTDAAVNAVTPGLFARYPTPGDLAVADPADVERLVHPTGFFRQKTKSLIGMAAAVDQRFGGVVPSALEDLVTLPGVGRKTGNVVRSVGYGLPGLPVDTHVGRLARRLGLTTEHDPVKAEHDLDALVPPEARGRFSLRLILHGRRVCLARTPRCGECVLADVCPSAPGFLAAPRRAAAAGKGPTGARAAARAKAATKAKAATEVRAASKATAGNPGTARTTGATKRTAARR